MKKLLVVYNICGISRTNLLWWIRCLENILKQIHGNFTVAVSGCMVPGQIKQDLVNHFGNKILYNFIDTVFTVNITFNKTVKKVIETYGVFDGYIYVDSGVDFQDKINCLMEIDKRISDKIGMMDFLCTNDNGPFVRQHVVGVDWVLPVGVGINAHVHYYDHSLYEFYDNLMPDIFLAFCTESVFTFLCAALKKHAIVIKDTVLYHEQSVDGPSSGFAHFGKYGESWNNLYGDLNILDIINDPRAKQLGLGYEECKSIMMHDPSAYDENGFAIHEELKYYIKDKLFIPKHILNYDNIICDFRGTL